MDNRMIQQLYEAYGKELLFYLYTLCRNWAQSEDLLQETFVKALLALPKQHSNIRAWLYQVARNLCFNAMEKEKRGFLVKERLMQREILKQDGERDIILGYFLGQERSRMLYRAMQRLPLQKREVLQMQYFSGMPLKEIAGVLHISPENARVLGYRAKRELKKYLEEDGYDGIS